MVKWSVNLRIVFQNDEEAFHPHLPVFAGGRLEIVHLVRAAHYREAAARLRVGVLQGAQHRALSSPWVHRSTAGD